MTCPWCKESEHIEATDAYCGYCGGDLHKYPNIVQTYVYRNGFMYSLELDFRKAVAFLRMYRDA